MPSARDGGGGLARKEHRERFGVMEMVSVLIMVRVTRAYKSVKTHRNVHSHQVHCAEYKLDCYCIGPEWQEMTTSECRQSSGIISFMAR